MTVNVPADLTMTLQQFADEIVKPRMDRLKREHPEYAVQSERDALIAAAPDLLEALTKCRGLFSEIRNDWTDPRAECREGWAIIDAAIAKATGHQP